MHGALCAINSMRQFVLYTNLLLIISCATPDKDSKSLDFDYAYKIETYYTDTLDNENLRQIDYYDKSNKPIRTTETDRGCTRFIYNKAGLLVEKIWGRNCNYGIRELMIYDSSKNLLGTYRTRDSLVNLDTIKYRQQYFYDANNNLIKEFVRDWNNVKGEHFEQWNSYQYADGKKIKEIVTYNGNLIWSGDFVYISNKLISINRTRGKVYWTESYKYDKDGRRIEEEIKSNEYPLTPETGFSAKNNKTIYRYGLDGRLLEATTLNHKGKVDSRLFYVMRRKN